MQQNANPVCTLNHDIVRANANVWRARSNNRLRAVIKSNGYGWGARTLAQVLESDVETFCVVDAAEFHRLAATTNRPLIVLGVCPPSEIPALLDRQAIPNITTLEELDAVLAYVRHQARTVRIRAGVAPSLGWNGIAPEIAQHFAQRSAAEPRIEIELWTHLTSAQRQDDELRAFEAFTTLFRNAHARIVGIDIASSAPAARGFPNADQPLRIGIGLFGAYCREIPGLRCALHLAAHVVSHQPWQPDLVAGYACRPIPSGTTIETLRIGYGDGLPRGLVGTAIATPEGDVTIASIGMQHTVITHALAPAATRVLLHPQTDLVQLCAATTLSPHELVLSLGTIHRSAS